MGGSGVKMRKRRGMMEREEVGMLRIEGDVKWDYEFGTGISWTG